MFDWSIHATFKKFELKESFSLIFYFADNNGDSSKKESYVGCINAFRGTTPETCTNCKKNETLIQEGFIHLNRILATALQSFDPADVLEFLNKKKLSYKLFTVRRPLIFVFESNQHIQFRMKRRLCLP